MLVFSSSTSLNLLVLLCAVHLLHRCNTKAFPFTQYVWCLFSYLTLRFYITWCISCTAYMEIIFYRTYRSISAPDTICVIFSMLLYLLWPHFPLGWIMVIQFFEPAFAYFLFGYPISFCFHGYFFIANYKLNTTQIATTNWVLCSINSSRQ